MTRLGLEVHEHRLANGLRMVVSPDPGVPSVSVNLWYDVGSRHETPGRTGFAHLFEHVMFQGSSHVGRSEHIALVQGAGGTANATTWFDRTCYVQTVPTGALELVLWLEADRLGGLLEALDQSCLDTQREVVKEEKRQRYDNVPYGDVLERVVGLVFGPEHPYGHSTIGSMADLDAAGLDDVAAFFTTHYRPATAVLSVVGDVTVEQAVALAERELGGLPDGRRDPVPLPAPLPPLTGVPRLEVTAEVPADALQLAWRLPALTESDFDACDLALAVLAEGQSSRLHRRLVREEELAESVAGSGLGLVAGTSLGLLSFRARRGVAVERCEEVVLAELTRLAAQGPAVDELERVRAQHERAWLGELSHGAGRAEQLSRAATLLGSPRRVADRLDQLAAITAGDVARACARWLDPGARAVLVHRRAADPGHGRSR